MYYSKRDLFALSTVSKSFSEYALDHLWKDIEDFNSILCTFSNGLILIEKGTPVRANTLFNVIHDGVRLLWYQFLVRPVTPADLQRFVTVYSHRIKSLGSRKYGLRGDTADVLEHLLVTGLFHIPNLQTLNITLKEESSRIISYLWIFLSPKLISFAVHCSWSEGFAPKEDGLLQTLIGSLPITTPNLRKFELSNSVTQTRALWAYTEPLTLAIRGLSDQLSTFAAVDICLASSNLLEILPRARNLSSFTVRLIHGDPWRPAQSNKHRVTSDIRHLSLYVNTLVDAVNFMNTFYFPMLQKFEVHTVEEPKSTLLALSQAVLECGCVASLTAVKILWQGGHPNFPQRVVISKHTLASFLKCHQIRSFALVAFSEREIIFNDLDDSFLQQLVLSWPSLEELHLTRTSQWADWTPAVKLSDIFRLMKSLPSLQVLGLDVDFDAGVRQFLIETPPLPEDAIESTFFLDVGYAIASSPQLPYVAAILSAAFRNVYIRSNWSHIVPNGIPWKTINTNIQIMRTIRLLERGPRASSKAL